MKEFWTLDAETDPFKAGRIPEPFIWGAYNGSEYHQFLNTDEMVDFFEDKDVMVYAHNGGKFDYHFILHRLEPFEPLSVISGRLAKFKIGLAEFRDSYNILPIPLAAYQKDEIDYAIMEKEERHKPHNWKTICDYLKSDCVYLWNLIDDFINRYGLHLTQAGAAMKVWQKISGIGAPKTSAFFYDEIAPYYYGGRVECFQSGIFEDKTTIVDINSAYPFAMKHKHPWGDSYSVSNQLPNSQAYIERSFIRLRARSCGAFPFRSDNGLSFPNDGIVREFTVTGWEYLAARDTETLIEPDILEVITFSDCIRFDEYIDKFYGDKTEAKENSDKGGYIFAKLFLNSLYGKFGANPENYDEYTIVKPCYIEAAECDGYHFNAELGGWALCSRPVPEERQRFYNVAVAASITGFVRAYMWKSINQCKGVIYCDTDSIFCRDTGELELDNTKLGAWDIEAVSNFGGVAGKKLYAFCCDDGKWKTASKGVKLQPEEIIDVAKGNEVVYNPISPSFSLKRGIKFVSRKVVKNA